jgi:hypothetical protein
MIWPVAFVAPDTVAVYCTLVPRAAAGVKVAVVVELE